MTGGALLQVGVFLALAVPHGLIVLLAVPSALGRPLGEGLVGFLVRGAMAATFATTAITLFAWVPLGGEHVLSLGAWFALGQASFAFDFLIDGLSLGFAVMATGMCAIVAEFSLRYLHKEPGFNRYFVLFALFATGIQLVALAGSVEVLFVGWELLGLSSALLVGFFHERPAPVRNALRVFAAYRVSDAAMLSAAVLLHHWAGHGSLSLLFSSGGADSGALSTGRATIIMALLFASVAVKSALLPFCGWLPRAMEGPTPSSAVYYGALSIHAGCFLLLRAGAVLEQSLPARIGVVVVGAATAIYATIVARAQTDVKSSIAYSALSQVGVIIVEIALGLYSLAFAHIVGHACFRLLQLLRAPNALHERHEMLNARGATSHAAKNSIFPAKAQQGHALYLFALERGFLDGATVRVLALFATVARAFDRVDHWLCGDTQKGPEGPRGSS